LGRLRKRLAVVAAALLLLAFVVVPAGIAYASLHPARCESTGVPADYGLDYEEFTVVTGDGVRLHGWVIEGSRGDAVFVVMHGYTSCKADPRLLQLAAALNARGFTVVMFDFRGHGESEGTTTIGPLEAEYDVPAVLSYVESRYPGARIVLQGYSMGAVAAIVAGAGAPGDIVVVADSPYPTLRDVIPRWLKHMMGVPEWYSGIISAWGGILAGVDVDFGPLLLDRVDKPLLVIVGDRDPLVTPEEARAIAAKSCCGEVVVVEGAGHVEAAEVMGLDAYLDLVVGFALR